MPRQNLAAELIPGKIRKRGCSSSASSSSSILHNYRFKRAILVGKGPDPPLHCLHGGLWALDRDPLLLHFVPLSHPITSSISAAVVGPSKLRCRRESWRQRCGRWMSYRQREWRRVWLWMRGNRERKWRPERKRPGRFILVLCLPISPIRLIALFPRWVSAFWPCFLNWVLFSCLVELIFCIQYVKLCLLFEKTISIQFGTKWWIFNSLVCGFKLMEERDTSCVEKSLLINVI